MKDIEIRRVISNNIRAERSRNNYSQDFVAKHLGVTRETYIKYETDDTKISAVNLLKLALLFKCKISSFYLTNNSTECE